MGSFNPGGTGDSFPGGVLVMTATVNPPASVRDLGRTDIDLRLGDYREAMKRNLEHLRRGSFSHLVLADNSGHGTAEFEDIRAGSGMAERIELMSFDDNRAASTGSRFLGECSLLLRALDMSRVLRGAAVRRFWKITGRYHVRNLDDIVGRARRDVDVNLHLRRFPNPFVDFGLVGFGMGRAREFLNRLGAFGSDATCDERELVARYDAGELADFTIQPRFPRIPDFRGVRGYDNASYGGLAYRAKFLLRSLVHRMMPQVWV